MKGHSTPPEVLAKSSREHVVRVARSELNNESLNQDPKKWCPEDARRVKEALLHLAGLINLYHFQGEPIQGEPITR